MLQSLRIQNFKGFKDVNFAALKRVNLITGKNNTGKTAALEALLLLLEPRSFPGRLPWVLRNCGKLGDLKENLWKWAFFNGDVTRHIIVSAESDRYTTYHVSLSSNSCPAGYLAVAQGPGMTVGHLLPKIKSTGAVAGDPRLTDRVVVLSARPTDPHKDVVNYDRVALKAGGEERLNSLLSKIEPRLKAVRSLNPYQAALLYADIGLKERIPAVHLGQGFVRLLSIYSEILASGQNDSVLLIDEFENGLHYSVLTEVWRGILNLAEQENVQVFATTHSYECIQAAHAAFAETLAYDFALHRLEEVKGEITVISYDRETLETSLKSNFEIR